VAAGPPVPAGAFFGIGGMPAGFLFASRYRVERLLGAGGMDAVYQAWDHELDVRVALKVIRPDVIGTAGSAQDGSRPARRSGTAT
jgi:hypothetical protein